MGQLYLLLFLGDIIAPAKVSSDVQEAKYHIHEDCGNTAYHHPEHEPADIGHHSRNESGPHSIAQHPKMDSDKAEQSPVHTVILKH